MGGVSSGTDTLPLAPGVILNLTLSCFACEIATSTRTTSVQLVATADGIAVAGNTPELKTI
jgi:hypothetical protein